MKKFLVLCESSVPATEQMKAPPEQMKAGFEGHSHFHAPGASIEVLEFIPMPAGQG